MDKEQNNTPESILDKFIFQTQIFRKPSLLHFLCVRKNIIIILIVCYIFFKGDIYTQFISVVVAAFYIFNTFKNGFFTYTLKISKEEKTFFNFMANLTKKFYRTRHGAFRKEAILAEELLYNEKKRKKRGNKK